MCISYKNSSNPKKKISRTKELPFKKKHQAFNRHALEQGDIYFVDERREKKSLPVQNFLQKIFS